MGVGHVQAEAQAIVEGVLLHGQPGNHPIEVASLQNPLLVEVVNAGAVATLLCTNPNRNVVIVRISGASLHLGLPVGVLPFIIDGRQRLAVFGKKRPKLGGIHNIQLAGYFFKTDKPAIGDLHLARFAPLGRDHDHAVGGSVSVNGGGGGIFQHVDGGDIVGRDNRNIRARHAVNDVEWPLRTVDGGSTAQHHRRRAVGVAAGRNIQARHLAL